jgi:hypothetical protein
MQATAPAGATWVLERRSLSSDERERILRPIFVAEGDLPTAPERGLLAAKGWRLVERADAWNKRILDADRRRARSGVDNGEGVLRAITQLKQAIEPVRVAVCDLLPVFRPLIT